MFEYVVRTSLAIVNQVIFMAIFGYAKSYRRFLIILIMKLLLVALKMDYQDKKT